MSATVVSPIPERLVGELRALYRGEWWTDRRQGSDVERMLAGPSITFALVDDRTGELLGFSRVLTDGAYVALVLDVIVRSDQRRDHNGSRLLNAVLDDPRVTSVASVELVCQSEVVGFYERFGFTDEVGGSRLMRRTADLFPAAGRE